MNDRIYLVGSGVFAPTDVITNEELVTSYNHYVAEFNQKNASQINTGAMAALPESSVQFIEKASGIKQRHVIEKSGILDINHMRPRIEFNGCEGQTYQCESSLQAAEGAIARSGLDVADIGAVILSSTGHERQFPSMAIEVQSHLNIDGYAYHMGNACSSATFAMQNACDAIKAGHTKAVLVVVPEFCSPKVDYRDRDSHFIFGDATVAMVICHESLVTSDVAFELKSSQIKSQYSTNIRLNEGYMAPCYVNVEDQNSLLFRQNGRRVFKEVIPMAASHILAHCAKEKVNVSDINRLWLHQANINMNRIIAEKILGHQASPQEAPNIIANYANTGGAGCIIAFHEYHQDLPVGATAVLSSFGAGYTIGSFILQRR